jgi:hypothetical protein
VRKALRNARCACVCDGQQQQLQQLQLLQQLQQQQQQQE